MLVLNGADVRSLLTMEDAIDAVERAQLAYSTGTARMPLRTTMQLTGDAEFNIMPAWMPSLGGLGAKSVAFFPDNSDRGLLPLFAAVLLLDPDTGATLALIEASHLTSVRTAAASAVATRALANQDAKRLAIIGAGAQASAHIAAMMAVRPIESVTVAASRVSSAERLVREHQDKHPSAAFEAVDGSKAAVSGADVICTVSTARNPVLELGWLKAGCHINAVGSHSPAAREIDGATMRAARVVVDSREANLSECGDCLIPIAEGLFGESHVWDEIGEVIAGDAVGRRSLDQITVYQSCGLAVQDIAVARLVYDKALGTGAGIEVEL